MATTPLANLTSLPTIDGITVAPGDRVLLTNQQGAGGTHQYENGIWKVQPPPTHWSRPGDSRTTGAQGQLQSGATVFVREGTSNRGTTWLLSTPDPITEGTTALTFVLLPGLTVVPPAIGPLSSIDTTSGALMAGASADADFSAGTGALHYTDNTSAFDAAISTAVAQLAGVLHFPFLGTGVYRVDGQLHAIDCIDCVDDITLDFHGTQVWVPSTAILFDTTGNTNLPAFMFRVKNTKSEKRVIIKNLHLVGNDLDVTDVDVPAGTGLYAKNPTMYNPNLVYGGIWLDPRCHLENVTVEGFAIGVAIAGDHCLIDSQCSFRNNTINLWYEKTDNQKDNVIEATYLSRARLASVGVHPFQVRLQDDLHGSCHLGFAPFGIYRPAYGLPRNDGATSPSAAPAWNVLKNYVAGDIVSSGAHMYIATTAIAAGGSAPPSTGWQADTMTAIFYSALSNFSSAQSVENSGDNVHAGDTLLILDGPAAGSYVVGASAGLAVIGVNGFTLDTTTLSRSLTGQVFAIERDSSQFRETEKEFIVNHNAADTTFENCGNAWIYDETGVAIIKWQGQDRPQFAGIDDEIQMPLSVGSASAPELSGNNGYLVTNDAASGGSNPPMFFTQTSNLDPAYEGEWIEIMGINLISIGVAGSGPWTLTVTATATRNHGLAVGDQVLLTSLTDGTQGDNGLYGVTVASVSGATLFTATYNGNSMPSFPGSPVMVREQINPLVVSGSSGTTGSEVTITTAQACSLAQGDTVVIAGHSVAGVNGAWVVSTVPSTTTFTLKDSSWTANGSGGFVYRRMAPNRTVAITNASGSGGTGTISTSPVKHGLSPNQHILIQNCALPSANSSNTVQAVLDDYTFTVNASGGASGAGGTLYPVEGGSWFFESRARFFRIASFIDAKRVALETDPMANCSGLAWRIVRYPRLGMRVAQFNESAVHLGAGQSLYHAHEMLFSLATPPRDLRIIFQPPTQPIQDSIWSTAGGLPPTIQVRSFASADNSEVRCIALSGDRRFELWEPAPSGGSQIHAGDLVAHDGSAGWQTQVYSGATMDPSGVAAMDGGPSASTYAWIATQGTVPMVRFGGAAPAITVALAADSNAPGGLAAMTDAAATLLQQLGIVSAVPSPLTGYVGAFLKSLVSGQQDRVLVGPWGLATVPANATSTVMLLFGTAGFQEWSALRSGYVSGISVALNGSKTGGSATFTVTKNGSLTSLAAVLNTTSSSASSNLTAQAIGFAANDLIGVKWKSTGFAPAGVLNAVVFVEVII